MDLEPAPFSEAVAYWLDKIKVGPKDFAELSDRGKAIAFAVSRIAKGDELDTVYRLLHEALIHGTTFEDFQAGAGDIFTRRGWSGGSAWKVESIFRTNIQSAYNAGQYQVLDRNRDMFPYWQYSAILDSRTSDFCRYMNGRVFPADSPVWSSSFPPNHFSCRSTVIGLTPEDIRDRGLVVESDNPLGKQVTIADGEETRTVELNPDKGFRANVGEVWLDTIADVSRNKVAGYLHAAIAQAVLEDLLTGSDYDILTR